MKATPYTRLEDAPLVCNIGEAARLLGRSVRDIESDLELGVMQPPPMPVLSRTVKGKPRKKQRRLWSRFAIEAWLRGEYLQFAQAAVVTRKPAPKPARRRYFGSAPAQQVPA